MWDWKITTFRQFIVRMWSKCPLFTILYTHYTHASQNGINIYKSEQDWVNLLSLVLQYLLTTDLQHTDNTYPVVCLHLCCCGSKIFAQCLNYARMWLIDLTCETRLQKSCYDIKMTKERQERFLPIMTNWGQFIYPTAALWLNMMPFSLYMLMWSFTCRRLCFRLAKWNEPAWSWPALFMKRINPGLAFSQKCCATFMEHPSTATTQMVFAAAAVELWLNTHARSRGFVF